MKPLVYRVAIRGDTRWRVDYVESGKRVRKLFDSESSARVWAAQLATGQRSAWALWSRLSEAERERSKKMKSQVQRRREKGVTQLNVEVAPQLHKAIKRDALDNDVTVRRWASVAVSHFARLPKAERAALLYGSPTGWDLDASSHPSTVVTGRAAPIQSRARMVAAAPRPLKRKAREQKNGSAATGVAPPSNP